MSGTSPPALGGEGCPEVAEFAVVEFAAALGRSTESGRRYLSHAVEGSTGSGAAGAGSRPGSCRRGGWGSSPNAPCVSHPEAAAFVDTHVAPVAHKIGPAQLDG